MIRRIRRWTVWALVVAACGAPTVAITQELAWFDGGTLVGREVISLAPGPARCGWESAAFLRMTWPPGEATDEVRLYVRDPEEVLPPERLAAPFGLYASLPDGARFTGLETETFQLWVAPDSDVYVYVVYGPRVEAWPRTDPDLDC